MEALPFSEASSLSLEAGVLLVVAVAGPHTRLASDAFQNIQASPQIIAFSCDQVSRYQRNVRLGLVRHGDRTFEFAPAEEGPVMDVGDLRNPDPVQVGVETRNV